MKVCTEKNISLVKDLYVDRGMTYSEVADALGVGTTSVRRMVDVLRKRGEYSVPVAKRTGLTTNPVTIAKVKELREGGDTILEIAKKLGMNRNTIYHIVSSNGFEKKRKDEPLDAKRESSQKYTDLDQGEELEEAMERMHTKSPSEIYEMNSLGMPASEIANRLGISTSAVYSVLENMPVKKDQKEAASTDDNKKEEQVVELHEAPVEPQRCDEAHKGVNTKAILEVEEERTPEEYLRKALGMILVAHGKMLMDVGESGDVTSGKLQHINTLWDLESDMLKIINSTCSEDAD